MNHPLPSADRASEDTKASVAEPTRSSQAAPRVRRSVDMRYINVLASLLAVFVSLLSLWLAYGSNRTQERMLAASSWPYLRLGHGNLMPDGTPVIRFTVSNGGSGPAILHWVRIRAEGRALGNDVALFEMVAPEHAPVMTWTSGTTGVALPPWEELAFLQVHRTEATDAGPGNVAAWDALNAARWTLDVDGCYCSIIGDCWTFTGDGQPQPLSACPTPPEGTWRG